MFRVFVLFMFALAAVSASAQDAKPRATTKPAAKADLRGTERQPLVIKDFPTFTKEQVETDRADNKQRLRIADDVRGSIAGLHKESIYTTVLTFVLLLVAAVQAFLFVVQLKDLKKATAIADGTARAARRSAIAAERTLRMTMRAESPYLIPEFLRGQTANNQPRVWYRFRNEGKSPAIIKRFQDRLRYLPALPEQPNTVFGNEPLAARPEQYIAVGPGHTPPPSAMEMLGVGGVPATGRGDVIICRIHGDDVPHLADQQRRYFLVGRVEYEDRFGVTRIQGFCWQVRFGADIRITRVGGSTYNHDHEVAVEN